MKNEDRYTFDQFVADVKHLVKPNVTLNDIAWLIATEEAKALSEAMNLHELEEMCFFEEGMSFYKDNEQGCRDWFDTFEEDDYEVGLRNYMISLAVNMWGWSKNAPKEIILKNILDHMKNNDLIQAARILTITRKSGIGFPELDLIEQSLKKLKVIPDKY